MPIIPLGPDYSKIRESLRRCLREIDNSSLPDSIRDPIRKQALAIYRTKVGDLHRVCKLFGIYVA